jgi:phasin family protein
MVKKPESPFGLDITQFVGKFKVPGVDVESVVASQRKSLEALTKANRLAFDGVQAVFKRQVEILRQTIEEVAAIAKDMAEPNATPQQRAIKQTDLVKEAFERAVANAHELSEIFAKSTGEAVTLLNRRFASVLDEIKDTIAKSK